MVERSTLLKEIESLPPCYYSEVLDFVGYIKEKKVKENYTFEKAAEMAVGEYSNNKELTAFSAIDSDDFHETR